jgi:carbonic anhydrase
LAKKWLAEDVFAGLVIFLVAVLTSLGVAQTVGATAGFDVPLASGIIAGIVGGIVIGVISGSHTSVSGPATGLIGIMVVQLTILPSFEAFLLAVLIAGLLQIAFGIAGLGFLSAFIPQDVLRGMLAAFGIILILKQLPHLIGHDTDPEGEMSFWQPDRQTTFSELMAMTGDFHLGPAVIGVASVAILLLWDYKRPKGLGILPGALVVVLIGSALHLLFQRIGGQWTIGRENLLQVPTFLGAGARHTLLNFPDFSLILDPTVYLSGTLIALAASLETLINLKAVDHIDPRKRSSPANRCLIAQGIGNTTCGLLGGLPVTAMVIHSAVNLNANGRTKRASIFHGVFFLVFVLFLPTALNVIPISALAAILFVTGIKLANPLLFRRMWEGGRSQFIPFTVTLLAIVFTDLLFGVLIGLAVSIGFIMNDNMRKPLRRIVERHLNEDVFHIELATQVSFLSAGVIEKTLSELPDGTHVLFDATDTQYIDPDILTMIKEFRDFTGPQRNIKVSLTGFAKAHQLDDQIQYVDYSSRELQSEITPAQVLRILEEGNERFRTGHRLPRDLRAQIHGSSVGQFPLAVVLSCIDSRNPVEIIFDLGLGDVFSVRVAGNVVGPNLLGSMEYSTAVAGAKLILVMGHTSCGAVNAAIKLAHASQDYEEATGCQNLAPIVDQIKKSIPREQWEKFQSAPPEEAKRFADEIAQANVLRVLQDILEQSRTIKRLVDEKQIGLIGAVYDVSSAQIEFFHDHAIGFERVAEGIESIESEAPAAPV